MTAGSDHYSVIAEEAAECPHLLCRDSYRYAKRRRAEAAERPLVLTNLRWGVLCAVGTGRGADTHKPTLFACQVAGCQVRDLQHLWSQSGHAQGQHHGGRRASATRRRSGHKLRGHATDARYLSLGTATLHSSTHNSHRFMCCMWGQAICTFPRCASLLQGASILQGCVAGGYSLRVVGTSEL